MIAWAGAERLALGLTDPLDVAPRARWPLDAVAKDDSEKRIPGAAQNEV
jgi:N6-L-threonylcarbamoyladenine synthase